MGLPTAFQPDHIARNLVIPKFLCQRHRALLCGARLRPVPKPQPPLRRRDAATGKHVVAPNRIQHLWTGKQIYLHTAGARNLDGNLPNVAILNVMRVIRIRVDVVD